MIGLLLCAAAQDPGAVLLLRNRNVPEGAEVAAAWRRWRERPDAPELVLDVAAAELISRAEYERDVARPLRQYLASGEGGAVRWIVPVYGVPLGIREQPGLDGSAAEATERNEAALDSELASLRAPEAPSAGWIESPLFDREAPLGADDELLGVIRLDASDAALAAALPEKAVLAELFGAAGVSFLDTRGMTDANDGYGERDVHMRGVAEAWRRLGLEFQHDDAPAVVDLGGRTLLHYEGWYAGDPAAWSGAPRFRTGAIAVHLHSFAARTLRDPRAHWVAPLLAWGATASFGTVFEPYTVGFPYEGIFWERMARGWTYGEAAAAASRLLSWQAVFVGDPLWRPYPPGAEAVRAEQRAAFAAALAAWPETPAEEEPFPRFRLAWHGFDQRLAAIREQARAGDEAAALAAYDDLHALCDGWEFEDALGAAMSPSLGAVVGAALKEVGRALARDPADRAAGTRLLALAVAARRFGHDARYAELTDAVRADQDALVERILGRRLPSPRSGRLLDHWRELRRAEACAFAVRAPEAAAARAALEADAERAEPLREEAEKSLARGLREVEQLLRRERSADARARLEELDHEHPDCPAKAALKQLRAAAGG